MMYKTIKGLDSFFVKKLKSLKDWEIHFGIETVPSYDETGKCRMSYGGQSLTVSIGGNLLGTMKLSERGKKFFLFNEKELSEIVRNIQKYKRLHKK